MSKQHLICGSALCVALLTSCGGSSGGNGSSVAPLPLVQPESDPIDNNTPAPPVESTGLDRLLGTVTFRYNFNGDATVFETITRFTSNSFQVSGSGATQLVTSAEGSAINCRFSQIGNFDYSCFVARSSDGSGQVTSMNGFLFNLSSATSGSGVFEFCIDSELDATVCATELVQAPDGPLTVSVNQFAKSAEASSVNSISATEEEFQTWQEAAEAEFGGPGNSARKLTASKAEVDELTEILQSLKD